MLVLSRRARERVIFPHLGIEVSVLQVKGRLVKLGIEAPASVRIFRGELSPNGAQDLRFEARSGATDKGLDHQRRNALNILNLQVATIQKKLECGDLVDVKTALTKLIDEFSSIDHELADGDEVGVHAIRRQARLGRLLVVEDSDNERELMASLLAAHGFDVRVARDGLEALEQLHLTSFEPDFILMDVCMPFADGLKTLLQIRKDERLRHLKVFAVTGTVRGVDSEPMSHGWDGWFQKPLDITALIARLRDESNSSAGQLAC